MRNNNHKPKRYSFPLPLVIRSDSPILITDGKGQLKHKGDIVIRMADTRSVEFEPQEPLLSARGMSQTSVHMFVSEPSVPEGYTRLIEAETKSPAYGGIKSIYEYYRRESDMGFIALIRRNEDVKKLNLGSLFDQDSTISKALREFSREKPFYRRDLKAFRMPIGLKHGQIIKACLDILVHEGFLDRTEVEAGKKRKIDRYVRTAKRLP